VVKITPKRIYTSPVRYGGDTFQPYYDRKKLEQDGCAVYLGRRPGSTGIFEWVWTDAGKAAKMKRESGVGVRRKALSPISINEHCDKYRSTSIRWAILRDI
jgi:hypothetical protein